MSSTFSIGAWQGRLQRLCGAALTALALGGGVADAAAQASQLAAGYRWQPVAVGGGGFIMSQDISANGRTRVIRTDTYGAYRWENDRWVPLITAKSMPAEDVAPEASTGGIEELVAAPSSPRRLYMHFKGWVYRSDDTGRNWRKTPFTRVSTDGVFDYRQSGPRMAVDPANPDIVLFGSVLDGLWRTRDGGRTWARNDGVPPGADQRGDVDGIQGAGVLVWYDKSAAPVGGKTQRALALSYGRGFYVTRDGGNTWKPLPANGGSPSRVQHGGFSRDGTFYCAGPDGVWRWRDGKWTDVSPQPSDWVSVAVDPAQSRRLLAFNGGGAPYRSLDSGATWTPLPLNVVTGKRDVPWLSWIDNSYFTTAQVIFDPVRADRLWVAGGAGVYRADLPDTANQLTWVTQSRGIEQLVANDVVSPPGGRPVLAGWDFGLRVSEDVNEFPATHGPFRRFNSVWQVDWTPADPSFMVAVTSDHRFCCAEDGGAVQTGWSGDGGRSWTVFPSFPKPPDTDLNDPWAYSFGSIAVSANDPNNIVWLGSSNKAPFYTLDRGVTWKRIVLPGEPATDPGSHFAYFLKRKNMAADRVLPNTFYYLHSGAEGADIAGLWRSTDAGRNWVRRFAGNVAPYDVFNATLKAVPGQAGHLFLTTGALDGVDSEFRRSVDGGRSWTFVPGMTRVYTFGYGKAAPGQAYPAVYAAGKYNGAYGLWRSTDNAATWQSIGTWPGGSLDEIAAMDGDKDVFGRVYIGLGGSGWAVGEPR
jgi:photosystem II stability/assembly factor-like uncharacterized protein